MTVKQILKQVQDKTKRAVAYFESGDQLGVFSEGDSLMDVINQALFSMLIIHRVEENSECVKIYCC